jgi:hypothetical protein
VNNPEPFGEKWSTEGVYPAEEALANFVKANKARTDVEHGTNPDTTNVKDASKKPRGSEMQVNGDADEKITKHASGTDTRKDAPKLDGSGTAADNYDKKNPEKRSKVFTEERISGRHGQSSSPLQRPSLLRKEAASSWSDNVEFEDVIFPPPPSWNDDKWQQNPERNYAQQDRSRSAAPDLGGHNTVTAGLHTNPPRGGQDMTQRGASRKQSNNRTGSDSTINYGSATRPQSGGAPGYGYVPRSQGAAPDDNHQAFRAPQTERGEMTHSKSGQTDFSQYRSSGVYNDSDMERDVSGSSYPRNSGVQRSDAGPGGMRRMPWSNNKGADYQNKYADNSTSHSSKSSSERDRDADDQRVSGSSGYNKQVASAGLSPEFEIFARGLRLVDEAEQSMLLRQDEVSVVH